MLHNPFILALATLVGTIVGAGIFGIPYAMTQSGALIVAGYFLVFGSVVWFLHLAVGEIVLRTPEQHRLIGYGSLYLGKLGKAFFVFTTVFAVVGALLAYIVIGGFFLQTLMSSIASFSPFFGSLVFWGVLSLFIVRGMKLIAITEVIMNTALFVVVALVLALSFRYVEQANIVIANTEALLLPFGVVLFALVGWAAIPEITDILRDSKNSKKLFSVIGVATIITALLYFVFGLAVAGVSGVATSQDALSGLVPFLGSSVVAVGAFFGLLTIAASFLVLGNYLKNSLRFDFGFSYILSSAVAILLPLILFLLGAREFVEIIALVGGVALGLEGVGILWLLRAAKQKGARTPEYSLPSSPILFLGAGLLLGFGVLVELLL
ncbi:MAG: aromatic amino acid transport family protein [bacterium]|nr:aromatic amino acid transport family protein [bacterium]